MIAVAFILGNVVPFCNSSFHKNVMDRYLSHSGNQEESKGTLPATRTLHVYYVLNNQINICTISEILYYSDYTKATCLKIPKENSLFPKNPWPLFHSQKCVSSLPPATWPCMKFPIDYSWVWHTEDQSAFLFDFVSSDNTWVKATINFSVIYIAPERRRLRLERASESEP